MIMRIFMSCIPINNIVNAETDYIGAGPVFGIGDRGGRLGRQIYGGAALVVLGGKKTFLTVWLILIFSLDETTFIIKSR